MERSGDAATGLRDLYAAFNAKDPDAFERCIAADAEAFVVGTQRASADRGEWLANFRELVSAGADVRLAEDGVSAWASGDVAFAFDRPAFILPGGMRLPTRLTAVLRVDDGAWRAMHAHFSVAVPDEVAVREGTTWLEQLGEPLGPMA